MNRGPLAFITNKSRTFSSKIAQIKLLAHETNVLKLNWN